MGSEVRVGWFVSELNGMYRRSMVSGKLENVLFWGKGPTYLASDGNEKQFRWRE